ncbi:histidinol phosphate phosphatase HisJ family [Blautia obeum ATCC 29174]|uniref:Histidinol-phosphatase n=2 Tax=Blautia obeum TaxID=40520 RepID=A5ZPB4_9FIRM|nr:histidinol phosphate phosphatase HisJ family [Blautia obeum ATCC 29174]
MRFLHAIIMSIHTKEDTKMSNQILWDCHMHSSFSADSDTSMEDMIREAICRGLTGICFTEHLDPDYPPTPDNEIFELDLDGYRETLFRLREKYQKELQIHFGIELGLQPHLHDYFHELLATMPFDFVIGSSHVVHGYDPYYKEYFKGREESACYREYFESILENLHAFSEMDVYGHIDYIVRYGPNQNKYYTYERYQDILDEILRTVIAKGRGIELNTGGFHYGLGEPNPCRAVIRRYRELGGEIITVGADAHGPEKIAYDFDKAAAILADCGFKYYTVFQNRKPEFVKL